MNRRIDELEIWRRGVGAGQGNISHNSYADGLSDGGRHGSVMADSRKFDRIIYVESPDDTKRGDGIAHYQPGLYRVGCFGHMFRGSGGTWQRDAVSVYFVVPLYYYHYSSGVFVQQIAGSDRNVVCLLFHRICGCWVIVFDLSETYDDKIK